MPRKSAAASLVPGSGPPPIVRPDAPYELNDAEAEVWRAVVNTMPPDWFSPANQPVLVRYCKQVTSGRQIDQMLEAERRRKRPNTKTLLKLMRMQMNSTGTMSRLAAKMRLTQQSVILPDTAGNAQRRERERADLANEMLNFRAEVKHEAED